MGPAAGVLLIGAGIVAVALAASKLASGAAGAQQAANAAGGASSTAAPAGSWGQAIATAAAKWGVPTSILTGVIGMETDFGRNIATSSAGAVGGFQFIPSTAASYGYPPTNTPNAQEIGQQADSAAHYLHDLIASHGGDWDAALHAYSGGGYGLAQVQAKANAAPGAF